MRLIKLACIFCAVVASVLRITPNAGAAEAAALPRPRPGQIPARGVLCAGRGSSHRPADSGAHGSDPGGTHCGLRLSGRRFESSRLGRGQRACLIARRAAYRLLARRRHRDPLLHSRCDDGQDTGLSAVDRAASAQGWSGCWASARMRQRGMRRTMACSSASTGRRRRRTKLLHGLRRAPALPFHRAGPMRGVRWLPRRSSTPSDCSPRMRTTINPTSGRISSRSM